MAPRQRFLLIALLALVAIAISAQVALSSPWLGLGLSLHGEEPVIVKFRLF
ncbi:hypothetical protein [Marinobacter sp. PE14]